MFDPGKLGEFEVIAYRAEVKICTFCTCSCRNEAEFREDVTAAVQYGPAIQAVAVYLNQYDFLPYKRVSEYFNTLYKMSVSAGTLANFVDRTHENLAFTEEDIGDVLQETAVAGADETGMRAEGSLYWLHVMQDERWTLYACLKNGVVRPWMRWAYCSRLQVFWFMIIGNSTFHMRCYFCTNSELFVVS